MTSAITRSGNLWQFAIDHCHKKFVDLPSYNIIKSLNMVMLHRFFVCLPVPKRIPAAAGRSRLQPSDMASSSRDFWVSRTTTKLSSEKISWEHEEFPHDQNQRGKHGKTTYTVI